MTYNAYNSLSVLALQVGGNWLDLAWVLFDGLQTDADTVRMIKDIQLKHPRALTDQVHDLMHRWWQRRGHAATIDQLQRALESVHMIYIQVCVDVLVAHDLYTGVCLHTGRKAYR